MGRARAILLLIPIIACNSSHKGGSTADLDPLTDVVDCAGLPRMPAEVAASASPSELLLDDLGVGTARVGLQWKDGDGNGAFLTKETTAVVVRGRDDASWAIGVDLSCTPDARTTVHFPASGSEVVPGEFAITAFGFDVPRLEQGEDDADNEVEGTVTVTSSSGGRVSGLMSGYARTPLVSFITQEYLGIEVEVMALAFHELPVE
jgi:hypothetical protein